MPEFHRLLPSGPERPEIPEGERFVEDTDGPLFHPEPPPELPLFKERPICAMCKKEIPVGETVYEIEGYTGTFFECESCFGPEGED